MKEHNLLADRYIEFIGQKQHVCRTPTWDDFFDFVEIPKENRTDFACACILKQVMERGQK